MLLETDMTSRDVKRWKWSRLTPLEWVAIAGMLAMAAFLVVYAFTV